MAAISSRVHVYHASAGTGKTQTLINVATELVKSGTPIQRIAFVSFTKEAATVARDRICRSTGAVRSHATHFQTIHSMCFAALHYHKTMMMDTEKYRHFGSKAGYNIKFATSRLPEEMDKVTTEDSNLVALNQLYRNNTPYAQSIMYGRDGVDTHKFNVYSAEYDKYKKTFGYHDFTDMLEEYVEGELWEDVDAAFIDEAQDCTPLQWRVLLKAFRYTQNIYVAGDDKQAVYRWAGADSSILTHLHGEQHFLDVTYRLPDNILDFVERKIVPDMTDIVKFHTHSVREGGVVEYANSMEEAMQSFSYGKTYYFLARNKVLLRYYKEWCEEHCLPYVYLSKPMFTQTEIENYKYISRNKLLDPKTLEGIRRYDIAGTLFREPNIRIDTIHATKGGEADEVIVMPDMRRKPDDNGMQEEHKCFYVACTRAKERLVVLEPRTRVYYGNIL